MTEIPALQAGAEKTQTALKYYAFVEVKITRVAHRTN